MLPPMPSLNLKPSHTFTTDIIPPTTTLLAKDQLMPKPNLKASHGMDMVVMEVMEVGMGASAVLLTLHL